MTLADIRNPYIGVCLAAQKIIGTTDTKDIVRAVVSATGVSEEQIKERNRKYQVVAARHLCWLLIKEHGIKMSLATIGKMFGDYDHTSVLNGIEVMKHRIKNEYNIELLYKRCKMNLKLVRPTEINS